MQITTTARHCELDERDRSFAEERLAKLGRLARDILEANLIVTGEKYRHTAEITLKLKHRELFSREQSTERRTAIDLAAGRIEQQLRRLKGRRQDRRQSGLDGNGKAQAAAEFQRALEGEDETWEGEA